MKTPCTATVIDTPEGFELFRLLQIKYAFKLELIGVKISSRRRVSAIAGDVLRKGGVTPPQALEPRYLLFDQYVYLRTEEMWTAPDGTIVSAHADAATMLSLGCEKVNR